LRALFLLLLLANVLFLAWTRWVVPSPSAPAARAAAASQALHPIRLQSEPAPAATAESTAPAAQSLLSASCVSVGPFIDPAHAAAATAQLERLGFSSRRRVAQDEVRVGYWVRVPGLATPADATNALATLQAAGLGEAYVIDGEETGTTLSIGVYANAAKAAEVARSVREAGFTPETSDRLRTLEVLWLDVDRQANGGLPAMEDLGEPPAGALPYDMRACPAAAGADDVTPAANPATPPAAARSAG
jgi:SPOR domain